MINRCCAFQIKRYEINAGCCLCWKCQQCGMEGCDMTIHATMKPPFNFPEKNGKKRLDCDIAILHVGERVRIEMMRPKNLAAYCSHPHVKGRYKVHQVTKLDGGAAWVCDIGPIDRPVDATINIDDQEITLIVTE